MPIARVPLHLSEVVRRTVREIDDDDCLGLAAQLAFYFFLSLFPALLFLVALIGYLPVEHAVAQVALALFIVTSLVLVLGGPDVASMVAGWVGLGPVFSRVWAIGRWPLMILLVVLGVDLVYHLAPNRRVAWTWTRLARCWPPGSGWSARSPSSSTSPI